MHADVGLGLFRRQLAIFAMAVLLVVAAPSAHAQDDGSTLVLDGGGQEILQSIFVPYMPNAPFSLTLETEWTRPLDNGGHFTVVNSRPIKRDSVGRVYMERWLLTPKGSKIPSMMSWIQIADPVAHTLYQCNARTKICDVLLLRDTTKVRFQPDLFKSGPLPDGKGTRTHDDLGLTTFAGVNVHYYRDTTTLNIGVLGNDSPMSTVREYRFSPELGINLTSVLEAPQVGRQSFTATNITTTEPDPSWFQPPQGYRVIDRRKPPEAPAN